MGLSGEMLLELLKPMPKSLIPKRLVVPLPPLPSIRALELEVPGGEASPLVIPLKGLPVPPLLPLLGPPMTVPRFMPNPIELEFYNGKRTLQTKLWIEFDQRLLPDSWMEDQQVRVRMVPQETF